MRLEEDLESLEPDGLIALLNSDTDQEIKRKAIMILGKMKYGEAYPLIMQYTNSRLRKQALIAMGKIYYRRTIIIAARLLQTSISGHNTGSRDTCLEAITEIVKNEVQTQGLNGFLEDLKENCTS